MPVCLLAYGKYTGLIFLMQSFLFLLNMTKFIDSVLKGPGSISVLLVKKHFKTERHVLSLGSRSIQDVGIYLGIHDVMLKTRVKDVEHILTLKNDRKQSMVHNQLV